MKHPSIPIFFSFVGVLLLGSCTSSEDKIVGKWKGINSIEENEGGGHMKMEIDEEIQYLANFTLIPVEADDMDQAAGFANLISEAAKGLSGQDEIIELTDKKLRLEDDEGKISKYRRVD